MVSGELTPGILALSGMTNSYQQEEWELRETDPSGVPVHAVFGVDGASKYEIENKLAVLGAEHKAPVVGWTMESMSLTKFPYYIRSNKVALAPGLAIGGVFKFQQTADKHVDKQIADLNPSTRVTLVRHGPTATCSGPVLGFRSDCVREVMWAWQRMRGEDARVIAHESGPGGK